MTDLESSNQGHGGNKVLQFDRNSRGIIEFAKAPYNYTWVSFEKTARLEIQMLASVCIFVAAGSSDVQLKSGTKEFVLSAGDSVQIENLKFDWDLSTGKNALVLVSGQMVSQAVGESIRIVKKGEHYRVDKPWGHELWINGEHPGYNFKEVYIKAGNRTSLQYHRKKEETNLLLEGAIRLFFKSNTAKTNDETKGEDLGSADFAAASVIHVVPMVLHRIEALTDTYLYEAATAFLDDVVRVQDDSSRSHGRIAKEHNTGLRV